MTDALKNLVFVSAQKPSVDIQAQMGAGIKILEREVPTSESEDSDQMSTSESDSESESGSGSESESGSGAASNESDSEASSESSSSSEPEISTKTTKHKKAAVSVPEASHSSSFYAFNEFPEDTGSSKDSHIVKSWPRDQKPSVGLQNRGVTCYMNTVVQILFHLPAFGNYMQELLDGKKWPQVKKNSVSMELANLYQRATTSRKDSIYPGKLIRRLEDINCMMSEWNQEDAHEYYMSLISRIQEDSVPPGQKLNSSVIHEMFGGSLDQKVSCRSCGYVSATSQDFYDIPVSLSASQRAGGKFTLVQSLCDFFGQEEIKISGEQGYTCEKCNQLTKATKQNRIEQPSEYLTVNLKRFKFSEVNGSQKVKDPISFPMILDLSAYTKGQHALRYQLVGVASHEGRTVSSGHYIAFCRQPDGSWAKYDDEFKQKVSEKSVRHCKTAYFFVYSRQTRKFDEHLDKPPVAEKSPLKRKVVPEQKPPKHKKAKTKTLAQKAGAGASKSKSPSKADADSFIDQLFHRNALSK